MAERKLTKFGRKVKIRLIEKNMTQVELAKMIGTTKTYLSRVLYGERSGDKYILKIAQILNIKIKDVA